MNLDEPAEVLKYMGKRLQLWRLHFGLTQEFVAEELKVSQGTVSKAERGVLALGPVDLWRLSQLYGCAMEDFMPPLPPEYQPRRLRPPAGTEGAPEYHDLEQGT